ncbi:Uncharacterised protein [Mycobacteroides abscessus subsp. abscessus]|nr:Uncharacterised protein [Mycobacteroides abscessus subsp. abscessus]
MREAVDHLTEPAGHHTAAISEAVQRTDRGARTGCQLQRTRHLVENARIKALECRDAFP